MQPAMTDEQKRYLEGFVVGANLVRTRRGLPTFAEVLTGAPLPLAVGEGRNPNVPLPVGEGRGEESVGTLTPSDAPGLTGPCRVHADAQDRATAAGGKLAAEEKAKRHKNPFAMWDEMTANALAGRFPKGTDVFLYKFHGLFYVAPAQDSFMCRLRFPGGVVRSGQLRDLARISREFGGGCADITTRANLQIREIKAEHALDVLTALDDAGIFHRGSGADNIRNITASPTAGIDPDELIDTHPLARELHHAILNHRELYGLPRKFNVAFDGGGRISVLEDTNDIGFLAVRVPSGQSLPEGVYFRMQLGGITGHLDFARDAGVMLEPTECTQVAIAVVRAFLEHGDRTDRRKARLKYVLDRLGIDAFLREVEKHLGRPLRRFPLEQCLQPAPPVRLTHVGIHPQKQSGQSYVGVNVPVGRLQNHQLEGIAGVADKFGSGAVRLTVWQNLIIPDVADGDVDRVREELAAFGLDAEPHPLRSSVIACTGRRGCKYAAADTKGDALQIIETISPRIELDQPINIHLTGCHHSCAQHYIGDIGLLATKIEVNDGEDTVEGYRVFLGGGFRDNAAVGREILAGVRAEEVPVLIERLLTSYRQSRLHVEESFQEFVQRHDVGDLEAMAREDVFA